MSWIKPLVLRDVTSSHRASTSLELFYDLCFVVAVAAIAAQLHHTAHDGEPLLALGRYLILFVPLWWALDDLHLVRDDLRQRRRGLPAHRAFGMMLGILGLAAAVPRTGASEFVPFTIAYVTVRVCIAVGYWRARRAAGNDDVRRYAHRYLVGYTGAGLLWTASLLLPVPWLLLGWTAAMVAELSTPV